MKRFLIPAILTLVVAVFSASAKAEDSLTKRRNVAPIEAFDLGTKTLEPPPASSAPLTGNPAGERLPGPLTTTPPTTPPWIDPRYTTDRAIMITCVEPGPNLEDTAAIARCGEIFKSWGLWFEATAKWQTLVMEAETPTPRSKVAPTHTMNLEGR